jgi:hypothetical protein
MFLRYKLPNFIVANAIERYKVPNNEVPIYIHGKSQEICEKWKKNPPVSLPAFVMAKTLFN